MKNKGPIHITKPISGKEILKTLGISKREQEEAKRLIKKVLRSK